MSTTELKLEIIKKLTGIDNEVVLEEIYRLVNAETQIESVYTLSDEEIESIQAGLEDAKAGRVCTSEEARAIVKNG